MNNEHEINRSAARPQDFDAAEAVRNYNERKKGAREIAREAVENRPQIDLETRFVPTDAKSDVDRAHDDFLAGYESRQMEINESLGGMKL